MPISSKHVAFSVSVLDSHKTTYHLNMDALKEKSNHRKVVYLRNYEHVSLRGGFLGTTGWKARVGYKVRVALDQ